MIDFALLGHPASFDHVVELLPYLRPDLRASNVRAHKTALTKAFEWSSPFAAADDLIVPRADGSTLRGKLIICTFLPEHAQSPKQLSAAYQKVREAMRIAQEAGAKIVGLGGFTSIVAGAQGEKLPREFGLAATSGNSLTAALAMAQIKTLLHRLNKRLSGRTVAVLGATGDIGKACTLALLAGGVTKLILVGRNWMKLESLRKELAGRPGVEVVAATDPRVAAAC